LLLLLCAAADGGVLYICGVPGTGKTALVMEVLGGASEAGVKAGAQFVAINCLQLPSPQHVFSRLWEKLSGQHLGPARSAVLLSNLLMLLPAWCFCAAPNISKNCA
jgi:origin recognition complex subunit 1